MHFAPFSECDMGHGIDSQLSLQGILVKYAITDGDSRSTQGLDNAMKILHPMWSVQRLADPTHLGHSQFRKCYQANFSDEMVLDERASRKKRLRKS